MRAPTTLRLGDLLAAPYPGEPLGSLEATRAPRGARSGTAVPTHRVRGAFHQIVEGLAWLHASGHVHRDVKPSNVIVRDDGVVKLVDFGLLARIDAPGESSVIYGTPCYLAPELCAAGGSASPASDFYALGVMLYLALTSTLPFEGPAADVMQAKRILPPRPPSLVARDVPADLEELGMALLARDPRERPDAPALLGALAA
jgi:serine/threonine protein kinase